MKLLCLFLVSVLTMSSACAKGAKRPGDYPIRNVMNSLWYKCKDNPTQACKPECVKWSIDKTECKRAHIKRLPLDELLDKEYYIVHKDLIMDLLSR